MRIWLVPCWPAAAVMIARLWFQISNSCTSLRRIQDDMSPNNVSPNIGITSTKYSSYTYFSSDLPFDISMACEISIPKILTQHYNMSRMVPAYVSTFCQNQILTKVSMLYMSLTIYNISSINPPIKLIDLRSAAPWNSVQFPVSVSNCSCHTNRLTRHVERQARPGRWRRCRHTRRWTPGCHPAGHGTPFLLQLSNLRIDFQLVHC